MNYLSLAPVTDDPKAREGVILPAVQPLCENAIAPVPCLIGLTSQRIRGTNNTIVR